MVQHRSHSIEFKRQVAQEFINGETLHALAHRHRDLAQTHAREAAGGDGSPGRLALAL